MRVLIVKTSSLGDVIHTLPAITDAKRAHPSLIVDWVVEENFADIPRWHPAVDRVIPIALRRWRKHFFSKKTWKEWWGFRRTIKEKKYDVIIDAQGLLKSAIVTFGAWGQKTGLDFHSAREPLASLFYHKRFFVRKDQHAIDRLRHLLSQVLHYAVPSSMPDYGIDRHRFDRDDDSPYVVFLHGTTWKNKHWPEEYWIALAKKVGEKGMCIKLLWGNESEKARAERIASTCSTIDVLPRLDLAGVASVLANAKAIVSVDTGLGHLAAALDVPTVSLYGPTNPHLTGALGQKQIHLKASFSCAPCLQRECTYSTPSPLYPPCFETLPPDAVWRVLETVC